jgi:hypothetical protein
MSSSYYSVDTQFSGEKVGHCAASNGVGLCPTTRLDRLLAGVPIKYLHKKREKR